MSARRSERRSATDDLQDVHKRQRQNELTQDFVTAQTEMFEGLIEDLKAALRLFAV